MFYLDLFRELTRYEVRYLLVGGLAMNLHGVPRMTMDVDIILVLDDRNLDAFMQVAQVMRLTPAIPVILDEMRDPEKRQQWMDEKNLVALPLRSMDSMARANLFSFCTLCQTRLFSIICNF